MYRSAIFLLSCAIISTAKVVKFSEKSKYNDLEPTRLSYVDLSLFRKIFFGETKDDLWVMDLDREGLNDLKLRPGNEREDMEFEDMYGYRIERYENRQKQIKALNQAISQVSVLGSKLLSSTMPNVETPFTSKPSTETPKLSSAKPPSSESPIKKKSKSAMPKKVSLSSKLLGFTQSNSDKPNSLPSTESLNLSSAKPPSSESSFNKATKTATTKKVSLRSTLLGSVQPNFEKPTSLPSTESTSLSSVKPPSSESSIKKVNKSPIPTKFSLSSTLLGSIQPNSEKPTSLASTEAPILSSAKPPRSESPIKRRKSYAIAKTSVLKSRLLSSTDSNINNTKTESLNPSSENPLSSQKSDDEMITSVSAKVKLSSRKPNTVMPSFLNNSKKSDDDGIKEEIMKIVNKFVLSAHAELNSNSATEEDYQEPSLTLYFKGPYTGLTVRYKGNSWNYFMTPPSPLPHWFYEDLPNSFPIGSDLYVKSPKYVAAEFYKSFLHMIQMFLGFPV